MCATVGPGGTPANDTGGPRVSVNGASNVGIGGSVIQSIIVTGTGNYVFRGDYERIRDAYIDARPVFGRVALDRFTGRAQLTRQLDAFLENKSGGYFVLEGAAGLGKTTFMAHLVRERHYIHHFVELSPGARGVVPGLKNLAAQIIRSWLLEPAGVDQILPNAAGRPDYLQGLLFEAAQRRDQLSPDEKIVLVVDALDEASGNAGDIALVLPPTLPDQVYILVSLRPGTPPPTTRVRREIARLDAQSPANLEDMREFLDGATDQPAVVAALREQVPSCRSGEIARQEFITTALRKSAGVWVYLRFLLDEIERGDRSLGDLSTLPDGLWQYYAQHWVRSRKKSVTRWKRDYVPLLTTLAATREPVSLPMLCELAGIRERPEFDRLLRESWRPFLVLDGLAAAPRYRLYHASLREFMEGRINREQLTDFEAGVADELAAATRAAHERIILRCRSGPNRDWSGCDAYGWRNLVGHLQAALTLEPGAGEQVEKAKRLYSVVLDPGFRERQHDVLGDLHATLADLRTTLQVALDRNDVVDALACIGAYRGKHTGRSSSASIAQQTLDAARGGDHERARRNATHYELTPEWPRVLLLVLAWDAAELGDTGAAEQAIEAASRIAFPRARDFCDALLVRVARVVAERDNQIDPRDWLARAADIRDVDALFERHPPRPPLAEADTRSVVQRVNDAVCALEQARQDENLPEAWVSAHPFAGSSSEPRGLTDDLLQIVDETEGREFLDRVLALFLANPYPRYRDLALIGLGRVCAAMTDSPAARERLRQILVVTLDQEGVTFTFDLARVLAAEATRRHLDALDLESYLQLARSQDDAWTTATRMASADAAAEYRTGNRQRAAELLRDAEARLQGYSGYVVLAALALANRRREFHEFWSPDVERLVKFSDGEARRVTDPTLSTDRLRLVGNYQEWWKTGVPDLETALATIGSLNDADDRTIYVDFASAAWTAESAGRTSSWLKALIPLSLVDGTRLDAVLGRLIGQTTLSDADVLRAIEICSAQLTTGRPWDAAPVVGPA